MVHVLPLPPPSAELETGKIAEKTIVLDETRMKNIYGKLLHAAIVAEFEYRMLCNIPEPIMYSLCMPTAALCSILHLAAPGGAQQHIDTERVLGLAHAHEQVIAIDDMYSTALGGLGSQVFVSVVQPSPAKMKVARRGGLLSSRVGIAVHECRKVDVDGGVAVVSLRS